jgi:hypothetical protein
MHTIKIFLASSSELKADRDQFEIFLSRRNERWVNKGLFLKPVRWENFLDAMSQTRLQEEYNRAIQGCDLFVTRLGKLMASFENFRKFIHRKSIGYYVFHKNLSLNFSHYFR